MTRHKHKLNNHKTCQSVNVAEALGFAACTYMVDRCVQLWTWCV